MRAVALYGISYIYLYSYVASRLAVSILRCCEKKKKTRIARSISTRAIHERERERILKYIHRQSRGVKKSRNKNGYLMKVQRARALRLCRPRVHIYADSRERAELQNSLQNLSVRKLRYDSRIRLQAANLGSQRAAVCIYIYIYIYKLCAAL